MANTIIDPTEEVHEYDEFDTAPIGAWTDSHEFIVDRMRLQAYARATNDTVPAHLSGDVASPIFNVVPGFKVIAPLTEDMPPPAKRMMGLHGEQDFRFHRPIEAGMHLYTKAYPLGVVPHEREPVAAAHDRVEEAADEADDKSHRSANQRAPWQTTHNSVNRSERKPDEAAPAAFRFLR